jgi:hypothetical protein
MNRYRKSLVEDQCLRCRIMVDHREAVREGLEEEDFEAGGAVDIEEDGVRVAIWPDFAASNYSS